MLVIRNYDKNWRIVLEENDLKASLTRLLRYVRAAWLSSHHIYIGCVPQGAKYTLKFVRVDEHHRSLRVLLHLYLSRGDRCYASFLHNDSLYYHMYVYTRNVHFSPLFLFLCSIFLVEQGHLFAYALYLVNARTSFK